MNGDAAGDRTVINPAGQINVGTGTTALKNSAGQTVAFLANNPNAMYITAPKGVLTNAGRQTEHLMPIDNLDLSLVKRFNVYRERCKLEFGGRFSNAPQPPPVHGVEAE